VEQIIIWYEGSYTIGSFLAQKLKWHGDTLSILSRDISISPSKITIIFGRAMSLVLFSIQYRSGYRDPVFTELKGGIMIF
jgi:hypothetical protein